MRVVNDQELLPPAHPRACSRHENWVIYHETPSGLELVETQPTGWHANHFCDVLNNHETRNGRPANYHFAHAPETYNKERPDAEVQQRRTCSLPVHSPR